MALIPGGDKIRREDLTFGSQRNPGDHLIQTFHRWEAGAVPHSVFWLDACRELGFQGAAAPGGGGEGSSLGPSSALEPDASFTLGQHL